MPNNFAALLSDSSNEEEDDEQTIKEVPAITGGAKNKTSTKKNGAVPSIGGYLVEKNDIVAPLTPALEVSELIAAVGQKPKVGNRSTKASVKGNKFAALMGDDISSEEDEDENEEVQGAPRAANPRKPVTSLTPKKQKSQLDRIRKCIQG